MSDKRTKTIKIKLGKKVAPLKRKKPKTKTKTIKITRIPPLFIAKDEPKSKARKTKITKLRAPKKLSKLQTLSELNIVSIKKGKKKLKSNLNKIKKEQQFISKTMKKIGKSKITETTTNVFNRRLIKRKETINKLKDENKNLNTNIKIEEKKLVFTKSRIKTSISDIHIPNQLTIVQGNNIKKQLNKVKNTFEKRMGADVLAKGEFNRLENGIFNIQDIVKDLPIGIQV